MRLVFPESSEDLSDAFNNAIATGVMQAGDQSNHMSFFARHELIASEIGDGVIVADWFFNDLTKLHIRVPRKDDLK